MSHQNDAGVTDRLWSIDDIVARFGSMGTPSGKRQQPDMTIPLLMNPVHWRDRAEEAREQSEQMNDLESKRVMLEISASYERLAQRAEKRLRDEKSK